MFILLSKYGIGFYLGRPFKAISTEPLVLLILMIWVYYHPYLALGQCLQKEHATDFGAKFNGAQEWVK
jgi:hypothetical protein